MVKTCFKKMLQYSCVKNVGVRIVSVCYAKENGGKPVAAVVVLQCVPKKVSPLNILQ